VATALAGRGDAGRSRTRMKQQAMLIGTNKNRGITKEIELQYVLVVNKVPLRDTEAVRSPRLEEEHEQFTL